jgi:hypothetical protein
LTRSKPRATTPHGEPPDIEAAIQIKQTEQYLARGRQLERTPVEQLGERWTGAFKMWVRDRTLRSLRDHQDADAELRLRGVEPPRDTIKEEIAALQKEIEKQLYDPETRKVVRARLQDLVPKNDTPKH